MNAVPSSPPLPDLTPEDHSLLLRYFSLNEDLTKLTSEPNTPDLLSLLRWLSRPDIAAYIAAYRTHHTHLHRQAVITALQTVLSTSTDQVEIRRAATTLLRALSSGGTTLRGVSSPSSPAMGGGGDARAAAGWGAVPTSPTHPPHTRGTPSRHAPLNNSFSPLPPTTPSLAHALTPEQSQTRGIALPGDVPTPQTPGRSPVPPDLTASRVTSPIFAEALAILGLPTDLEELDRLEDEADDAADDAELDAYADWSDNPDPNNST